MKSKTRILLAVIIIIAPVVVILLPAVVMYVQFGENYFLDMSGTIVFWFLGILVGYVITKQIKKSKTNASKETAATKVQM